MHSATSPNDTHARAPRAFGLTRHFSLVSLVGVVVVTVALIGTYRELTRQHLVEHESRDNASLARLFANSVWARHRGFVVASAGRSSDALRSDPGQASLRADVLEQMRGLHVVKIKVYNRAGMTVFSTDSKQVGEDKSGNDGFRRALAGQVSSEITFRERFDAFEGVVSNRDLIASYVPVAATPGQPPEGVFEVYSDVTDLLAHQSRAQWQVVGLVLGLLGALYLFLLYFVRKADRVIARQDRERAEREAEVRHLAFHDALTGLPNRADFGQSLARMIDNARSQGHPAALMFVDLDRFKTVNDSLGHEMGDRLLKDVAARIQSCMRATDRVFRMGGDEFAILLPRIEAPEDAAEVAQRVVDAVARPVSLPGHTASVGASIGIAVALGHDGDGPALLKQADAAMYQVKSAGRGSYAFYRHDSSADSAAAEAPMAPAAPPARPAREPVAVVPPRQHRDAGMQAA